MENSKRRFKKLVLKKITERLTWLYNEKVLQGLHLILMLLTLKKTTVASSLQEGRAENSCKNSHNMLLTLKTLHEK